MKTQFDYEKLSVYQKSIAFITSLQVIFDSKQISLAVYNQINRASESIVLNLVQGNSMPLSDARLNSLDYSLGSTLECAACIDILKIWEVIPEDYQNTSKQKLFVIANMLIGLRKSVYRRSQINEEYAQYDLNKEQSFFSHEKMQVYRKAIEYVALLKSIYSLNQLTHKDFTSLDKYSLGIVLNIAEGNGRFSSFDHRRFFNMAMSSALKSSAYLDIITARQTLEEQEVQNIKKCLKEIFSILFKLCEYWENISE